MFEKSKKLLPLKKEWYILIHNQQEGPYTIQDLKNDYRFNPDTLVWKFGFSQWVSARSVVELEEVFVDESDEAGSPDENSQVIKPDLSRDEATLALQPDPYQYFLFLLLALLIFLYALYQLNN